MTNAANLIFDDKVFLTMTALMLLNMSSVAIKARVAISAIKHQGSGSHKVTNLTVCAFPSADHEL